MKPQVGLALNSEMLHRTVGIVVHTYGQRFSTQKKWSPGKVVDGLQLLKYTISI